MSKKSKKKFPRKKILTIVIVAGVLIVAVSAGALVRFMQQKTTSDKAQEDEIFVPGENLPKAATDSQALAGQGKFDEANKKIEEALNKNPEDEAKYELYIQQGINYHNQKDYAKALENYRQAEAIKKDYKVTVLIGDVAMLQGNKALALEYYRKAIELLAKDDPLYESEKRRLEDKIRAAGG